MRKTPKKRGRPNSTLNSPLEQTPGVVPQSQKE